MAWEWLVGAGGLAAAFLLGGQLAARCSHRREEAALRYRTIFENSQSVMLLVDPESGRIVQANDAARRYYGYPLEALVRMSVTDLNTMPKEAVFQEMQRATSERRTRFHFKHRLASGELRDVEVFTGPVDFGGRDLLHSVVHDIQDRVQAELALEASERKYRTLAEQLGEGLVITDQAGRYQYCNRRFAEILGYEPEELLGKGPLEPVGERDQERLKPKLEERRQGRKRQYEMQMVRKDGTTLDCLLSATPLLDEQGGCTGSLVLCTDITERKRAEEASRQSQKSEGLNLMASGIAHDFNNLFQALQGNLELVLANPADTAKVRTTLERALRIVGEAANLSKKILDYSGRGLRQAVPVDLRELLLAHLDELKRFVKPSIRFQIQLAEDLPAVKGDPEQILQVVNGLIANADEALEETGGEIRLVLDAVQPDPLERHGWDWVVPPPTGSMVCLSVADDGKGIPPEHLGRIFDPFFSTKAAGRGLGLSASIGIVRNHQAGLRVRSTPSGSTFRICFQPLCLEQDPQCPLAEVGTRPSVTTLLLVDDDPSLREVMAEGLRDLLGYQVLVARDGVEAVEVFQEHADRIALILMDAVMPRLPGGKAFEAIKQVRPAAKAILCSGYGDDVGVEALARYGFQSFLKKPFSFKELAEAIEKALGA